MISPLPIHRGGAGTIDLSGPKPLNTIFPISVRILTYHQRQPVDKSLALSIQVLHQQSMSSPAPVYIVVSDVVCVWVGLGHHVALRNVLALPTSSVASCQ